MSDAKPTFEYDPKKQILHVGLSGIRFDTLETTDRVFEAIRSYWRVHCRKQKIYAVIDYSGVVIEPAVFAHYIQCVKSVVDELAITTVRYSSDVLTRSKIRRMSVMIHRPSNLYETRQEALDVVEAIRKQQMNVDNSA
jgi:hypothetical protein